jgi:hypothetical protein
MQLGHVSLDAQVGRTDLGVDDAGGLGQVPGAGGRRQVGQLGAALVEGRHQHVLAGFRLEEEIDLMPGALEDEARRHQAARGGRLRPRQRFVQARAYLVQTRQVAVGIGSAAHRMGVGHEVDQADLHPAELVEDEAVVLERLAGDRVGERPAHHRRRGALLLAQRSGQELIEARDAGFGQVDHLLALGRGQRGQLAVQLVLLGAREILGAGGQLGVLAYPVLGKAVGPGVESLIRLDRLGCGWTGSGSSGMRLQGGKADSQRDGQGDGGQGGAREIAGTDARHILFQWWLWSPVQVILR